MNKEDVLNSCKHDMAKEEYNHVLAKGNKIGSIVFMLLVVFLIVFDIATDSPIYEVETLFWAFFAGILYSKYRTYKRKTILIGFISSIIACLAFLAQHIIHVLNL